MDSRGGWFVAFIIAALASLASQTGADHSLSTIVFGGAALGCLFKLLSIDDEPQLRLQEETTKLMRNMDARTRQDFRKKAQAAYIRALEKCLAEASSPAEADETRRILADWRERYRREP